MADESTVYCELCNLPHRTTAIQCDRCEHRLGTRPDFDSLRAELGELKQKMLLGLAALMAMVALSIFLFRGAGIIIVTAPVGWIMFSAYRHRVVSSLLTHQGNDRPT